MGLLRKKHILSLIFILLILTLVFWPQIYTSFHSIDEQILRAVNLTRLKALDPFFIFITGSSSAICLLIPLIVFLIGWIKGNSTYYLYGTQLLLTFLTSFILIKTLKYVIGRERPFVTHDFLETLVMTKSYSFPSGHTFEAFAMATAVILIFRNKLISSFFLLWAVLVGFSRMILGVHYLSDVLGGIILGILTGYVVRLMCQKYLNNRMKYY